MPDPDKPVTSTGSTSASNSSGALDQTIDAGLEWLDHEQSDDGYWRGMLESNCCMEAEWVMAFHVLGLELPGRDQIVTGILSKQRDDGAFETYFDAPSGDVNTTVESYVALRICGLDPESAAMRNARQWILDKDALRHVRVFTRYWLALLGEWPWARTPNLPPEIMRMPLWMPFNIYRFACWARATLVPLCVLSSMRYVRPLPEHLRPHELFPDGREDELFRMPRRGGLMSWESLFRGIDRVLHKMQDWGLTPGRNSVVARCNEWILRHQDSDGSWGGIQPPWIYSLMALNASGYALDHPAMAKGIATLNDHWSYERDGHRFIQACESPVWDTLLTLTAMQECDAESRNLASTQKALQWILAREIRTRGDWSQLTPHAQPGGWAFERANQNYPDLDDTAIAILVLARLQDSDSRKSAAAPLQRAIDWALAMQSDNGGWGAFDRNNDTAIITKIPFCDFGEVLDPPSADVTAHIIEALAAAGYDANHAAVRRAIDYLWSEQEPDGGWFGRWGVNYLYGTAAVLPALVAVGVDRRDERIARAEQWIINHQNADGGWGESCASYMELGLAGRGVSTASQTSWGLIALMAGNNPASSDAIREGLHYLVSTQNSGTWHERHYTGTGFPGYGFGGRIEQSDTELEARFGQGPELARAFMINYNLYRHYFPLIALGRARQLNYRLV